MSGLPVFLVIEDGDEYTRRFRRFLGTHFDFQRVTSDADARAALMTALDVRGLLLDLDFRRSPARTLIDDDGNAPPPGRVALAAQRQGIVILRHLRGCGVQLPALLFADLDDARQESLLEAALAPLAIVRSTEGLPAIADRMAAIARSGTITR